MERIQSQKPIAAAAGLVLTLATLATSAALWERPTGAQRPPAPASGGKTADRPEASITSRSLDDHGLRHPHPYGVRTNRQDDHGLRHPDPFGTSPATSTPTACDPAA
jgi:hypothetical protein